MKNIVFSLALFLLRPLNDDRFSIRSIIIILFDMQFQILCRTVTKVHPGSDHCCSIPVCKQPF